MTFPNILDTSDAAHSALAKYETLDGLTAVPMTYLIDREGKVVDAWYDYREGRAEKALKELGF